MYKNRELTGVHRAWDHHRFAAIRNHLTAAGLLVWHRDLYVIGTEGEKGRACCFSLAPELVDMIEQIHPRVGSTVLADNYHAGGSCGG